MNEKREPLKYIHAVWIALSSSLIFAAAEGNWLAVLVSVLTLMTVGYIVRLNARINFRLPGSIIVLSVFFIYASLFLGEAYSFYEKFWWWDILLHSISSLGFGFIGMILLIALLRSKKINAVPSLVSFFAFTSAIAIGALWEIFEFAMDQAFGLNMQKSGLRDTMTDLIMNGVGVSIACVTGFFYLKFGRVERLVSYIDDAVESVFE